MEFHVLADYKLNRTGNYSASDELFMIEETVNIDENTKKYIIVASWK